MKKRRMKLLSLLLSCSMTFGMIAPVAAEPVGEEIELASVQEEAAVSEVIAEDTTLDEDVISEEASADEAETETVAEDEISETVEEDTESAEEAEEKKEESEKAEEKEKTEVVTKELKSQPAMNSEKEEAKTQAITTTVVNSEGAVSGMYSMENAVVTKQEDGTYLLRMHQISANRDYMAIVPDQSEASKDMATNHEVDWYIGGGDDGFWYVIPVASLDDAVYLSFSKAANVEAGKAWGNVMKLTLDKDSLTETDAADVTAAEMNIQPAVGTEKEEAKTQAITTTVVNSEGAVSGMYSMENAVVTKQEDGTYLLRMHQISANRDYMAIVPDQSEASKDMATNHEVDWYIGGGDDGFWYVIPVASLDDAVYLSFSKAANVEAGKAWGNVMKLTLDKDSLTETDAADVTAAEMNIQPAVDPAPEDPEQDPEKEPEKDPEQDPEKEPEKDPEQDPEKEPEKDPEQDPEKEPEKNVPADGSYTATATTSSSMFKVTDVKLTVKDGQMTAVVTLSGTGYDYLFVGTKEEAYAADESAWIPAVENADGQYTYTIPVTALDTPLAVASRSAKYASQGKGQDAWLDRTITIDSSSLKEVSQDPEKDPEKDPEQDPGKDPGKEPGKDPSKPTPTPAPDNKPAEESKYESDTSGSTSAVNSSTTLKDGTYTPDRFAFSGGTGKVNITCSKITVKNGQAFATLVFSSSSYQYVKANGNKYNTTKSGSTASVTIPVELNKNNTIIGMTTKMSAAHEIQYSIFIYLAAAEGVSGTAANTDTVGEENKLDEKAPEILGLKAIESDKEVKSDYLKIFEYEGGIKLVEIALTKDTVLDPDFAKTQDKKDKKDEKNAASEEKADKDKSATKEENAEKPVKPEQTLDEVRAELYQQDVVKYLVVPKDAEVPAGLDKQVIVINLPLKSAYASSEEAISFMDELNLLDSIKAVGFEKEDCKNKDLKKAMEKEKVVFAGTFEDPKSKAIVKQKTDLVLESDALLPLNENVLKDRAKDNAAAADEKDVKYFDELKADEKLTADDYKERMTDITDRMAALNIPVLIDRSADEKTELGKAEWIRLYGILFNCEEEAEKLYEKTVSEIGQN